MSKPRVGVLYSRVRAEEKLLFEAFDLGANQLTGVFADVENAVDMAIKRLALSGREA